MDRKISALQELMENVKETLADTGLVWPFGRGASPLTIFFTNCGILHWCPGEAIPVYATQCSLFPGQAEGIPRHDNAVGKTASHFSGQRKQRAEQLLGCD